MGLRVSVYRNVERALRGVDCTNGGISAEFDRLTVVNVEGPFEPSDDAPAVKLVEGVRFRGRESSPVLRKADHVEGRDWNMFGGNFAFTSDSRWRDAVRKLGGGEGSSGAVPIHDRYE